MKNVMLAGLSVLSFAYGFQARAANPLTADQLLRSLQNSLAAEAKSDPDMFASTSGFRVATSGQNAQVVIEMKADGMNMSSKYLCVAQGQEMACRSQQ